MSRPEAPVAPTPSVSGGALAALSGWDARRWWVAAVAASATALVIGLPTDVIPNPMFGRPVDVTEWSGPVLAVTAVLGGLLAATYVRADRAVEELDRPARVGSIGGLLGFFAVGCPVCNKLVVVALGTTGALELFAPVQPLLAVASVAVLALALRARLRTTQTCSWPS